MTIGVGKKLHISWFIAWASFSFVIGVAASRFVAEYVIEYADTFWLIALPICLVLCLLGWSKMVVIVVVCVAIVGLHVGGDLLRDLRIYEPYFDQVVLLQGQVAQDASYSEKGDQRILLQDITMHGQVLPGEVWLSAGKPAVKRGDRITVKGKLQRGFGTMAAVIYRAEVTEITRPYPGDIARRIRDWFGAGVQVAIPDPQSSLGLGYLVGQRTALPPDLDEAVRRVGLSHVVVASGYNLTILVLFARRLFTRFSKYLATCASVGMIGSFMFVTGFSPSMSRAGVVALVGLLTWYYGRTMHPFVLLSVVAAITVVLKPSYAWGDLGWALSFLAFIGVLVVAPLMHHYFWGTQEGSSIRLLLVETVAAQIMTMPIILVSFGMLSLYAIPANMLVLPFVPMAMLTTFLGGIGGILAPSLGSLAGLPANAILHYSIQVIYFFAELPLADKEVQVNSSLIFVSYLGIGIIMIYMKRRTLYDFRTGASKL